MSTVIKQYVDNLVKNKLDNERLSAYKQFHITETLLTKIHNDIRSGESQQWRCDNAFSELKDKNKLSLFNLNYIYFREKHSANSSVTCLVLQTLLTIN